MWQGLSKMARMSAVVGPIIHVDRFWKIYKLGGYSKIYMVTIYLVGPIIHVEVINMCAIDLGPLMNHLQKI
jgi:hypothetical protein